MPANAGQILVPIDLATRVEGDWKEKEANKKPWRLSWRSRRNPMPSGRTATIENLPVQTAHGPKTFNALQVACMAFQAGYSHYDVLHVHTPVIEAGGRGTEHLYFKCDEIRTLDQGDPDFFPNVEKGLITMEEETVNTMPRKYEITPGGLFVPSAR